jgi:hypothetical protein
MAFESEKESEKTKLAAPDGTQSEVSAEKSPQLPTEQKLERTALLVRVAPLVRGEDPAAYHQIVDRLYNQVKPKDFIEETYVDDAIDHIWEIYRLRKYLTHLINGGIVPEIVKLLEPTKGKTHATELARVWWVNKDQAQGEVAELLTNWGLAIDDLAARSYAALLPVIDRLKGEIADAEKQRNAARTRAAPRKLCRGSAACGRRNRRRRVHTRGGEWLQRGRQAGLPHRQWAR